MTELMAEGLRLALFGLGTVFLFLTLLVGATALMSTLVSRFEPESPSPSPAPEDESRLLAAVATAVKVYRRNNRRG